MNNKILNKIIYGIKNNINKNNPTNNPTNNQTNDFTNIQSYSHKMIDESFNDLGDKLVNVVRDIDVDKLNFPSKTFDIIFEGGGLKGYYLFGAIEVLKKMVSEDKIIIRKCIGVSVGALAAVSMVSDIPLYKIRNAYEFIKQNNLDKNNDLNKLTRLICEKILSDDIHLKCNGKISILLSKITKNGMKSVYVDNFNSKNDLINALVGSSCIPYFTSNDFKGIDIGNNIFYDGAFTNYKPIIVNNDIPQLVFNTLNVEYSSSYMFKLSDKCPELLILRGALELEKFIKCLQNNSTDIKLFPIEWIDKHRNITIKKKITEKIFYNILVFFGVIISNILNFFIFFNNFNESNEFNKSKRPNKSNKSKRSKRLKN